MYSSNVLSLLSPLLLAPWSKELESTCKEISKKIESQAKSLPREKLTEAFFEKIVCAEVGKLGKRLTKVGTGVMKKGVDANQKKVDAEIKKKDPSSSQALELTGLRDDLLKARKERNAVEPGKPIKLSKPLGGGLHVPIKVRVLSKDKIELNIELFVGINYKDVLKGKPKELVNYGILGLGGRF